MGWFDHRPGDGGGSRDEFDGVYFFYGDSIGIGRRTGGTYVNANNDVRILDDYLRENPKSSSHFFSFATLLRKIA